MVQIRCPAMHTVCPHSPWHHQVLWYLFAWKTVLITSMRLPCLQRNLSILVAFGCPSSLWNTSKVFQMEQQLWDNVIGGRMYQESQVEGFSRVSFLSTLAGEEIYALPVSQHCTIFIC